MGRQLQMFERKRRNNRAPVAHVAKVTLTADEHAELETIATLERTTYADLMRRALRAYIESKE